MQKWKLDKMTRKYINKKGELVIYEYDKKQPVNKLTTKKGKLSKKAEKILEANLKDASENKIRFFQDTLRDYQEAKKVITLNQLNAMYEGNRLSIFLANMQISTIDIVKDLALNGIEVSESWLLDESHWTFDRNDDAVINLPNGSTAYFVFNYNEHTYDIEVEQRTVTSEDVD